MKCDARREAMNRREVLQGMGAVMMLSATRGLEAFSWPIVEVWLPR